MTKPPPELFEFLRRYDSAVATRTGFGKSPQWRAEPSTTPRSRRTAEWERFGSRSEREA